MKNRVCIFLCKCGFSLFSLPLFRNLDYTVFIFFCILLQIFCLRWEEIILNKLLKTQSAAQDYCQRLCPGNFYRFAIADAAMQHSARHAFGLH